MSFVIELILFTILLSVIYSIYFSKAANYFTDRGIPYVKPIWPFGSDIKGLFLREHPAYTLTKIYNELSQWKVGGYYSFVTPVIMVRDPEYIQRIYTTDFAHFVDRGIEVDEKSNPLEGHLFLQCGAKWRYLRAKLSPIFTSGKLKWMFSEMMKCVDLLADHLNKSVPLGDDIDLKEDTSSFTTEVISSCAFGIEANCIGNPESKFRKFAKDVFTISPIAIAKAIFRQIFPKIARMIKLRTTPRDVENFVMDVVKQTFDHRLSTGYKRNDFIQLLLQLREKGTVEFDDHENDELDEEERKNNADDAIQHKDVIELNDGILGAQLFVFFVAGFETTSSTIYHLIYLFSQYPSEQEKARQEVKKALVKHGGYTYDMVKDLDYLSKCIDETLRMFPPLPLNFRVCTKDYTFPDGMKIEKGTKIFLPVYSIQNDPKYFPEPNKFKPERFDHGIVSGSFSPFGDGPRICIGKRFALVEIKLVIARILTCFQINPSDKTNNIKFTPKSFLLQIEGGLHVKFDKLLGSEQ